MLFAAGKNGAPAVDFRRKIQYTVGVIVDRKPGEQSKRAENNIISGGLRSWQRLHFGVRSRAPPAADAARRSTRRGRKNRAGEQREDFFGNRKPGEQGKRAEKSTIVQG